MVSSVRTKAEDGTIIIALEGHLDAGAGDALLKTLETQLEQQPARVDIDLSVLESFASEGAAALSRCRDLCRQLPDGLHYRTEGGAGQLALLSAFEREPELDSLG